MAEYNKVTTADITCKPIDTLEEVLEYMDRPPTWAAHCLKYRPNNSSKLRNYDLQQDGSLNSSPFFCHYEEELTCERYEENSLPKTLICHDMANGYHDDRFVHGTANCEAYHFYDWAAIDVFCYFSHHFVTIPPVAWINAAHTHDAKVMGTIITEWEDGEKIWDKILASPEDYRKFADSVVAIAKYLRFEGWLLNVENKISKPQRLLDFVRYLNEQLHQEIPGAVLLWYDSVTINGHLDWQNGLNKHNIDFFHACDGIFTNYSWSERHIAHSAALATAEGRLRDVFVGVDVWGRNFYGGGHFNTVEAVKVAFKHGCSLAIFAPAWTYEGVDESERYPTLGETLSSGGTRSKYDQFLLREKAFWDSLWPYLHTRVPNRLPFSTSFCRGNGQKMWRYGEIIKDVQWHNMKDMEYQLNTIHGFHGYRLVKIEDSKKVCPTIEHQTTETSETLKSSEESTNEVSDSIAAATAILEKQQEEENIKDENSEKTVTKVKKIFGQLFNKMHKVSDKAETIVTENKESEINDCFNKAEVSEDESMSTTKDVLGYIQQGDDNAEVTLTSAAVIIEHGNRTGESSASTTDQLCWQQSQKSDIVRYKLVIVPDEVPCVQHFSSDSFNGGSCLIVEPYTNVHNSDEKVKNVRLFYCEFICASKLIIYVVTKILHDCKDQALNIVCTMSVNNSKKKFNVVLMGQESRSVDSETKDLYHQLPVNSTQLKNVQKYLLIDKPGVYVPIENDSNWKVRYFVLDWPGTTLTSISCCPMVPQGPILLGQIGICPVEENLIF